MRLLGNITAAVAASVGLAAICGAQAQQSSALPGWLLSPIAFDSRPNTFMPADRDRQPAGSADAGTPAPGEKGWNLGPLGADDGATVAAPSGHGAMQPLASRLDAGDFGGPVRLGGVSLGFETETKVRGIPLLGENDTGYDDINPRPGHRIPFIGLSIVSPIQ